MAQRAKKFSALVVVQQLFVETVCELGPVVAGSLGFSGAEQTEAKFNTSPQMYSINFRGLF